MSAPSGIYHGEGLLSLGIKGKRGYKATGEFRAPKQGEFYLSGAIVTAYRAPNDLTQEYWTAREVRVIPQPDKWEWVTL